MKFTKSLYLKVKLDNIIPDAKATNAYCASGIEKLKYSKKIFIISP